MAGWEGHTQPLPCSPPRPDSAPSSSLGKTFGLAFSSSAGGSPMTPHVSWVVPPLFAAGSTATGGGKTVGAKMQQGEVGQRSGHAEGSLLIWQCPLVPAVPRPRVLCRGTRSHGAPALGVLRRRAAKRLLMRCSCPPEGRVRGPAGWNGLGGSGCGEGLLLPLCSGRRSGH